MIIAILIVSVLNSAALCFLLHAKYQKKRVTPEDLVECLTDIKAHGYSVIAIRPDSVMYRSPKA